MTFIVMEMEEAIAFITRCLQLIFKQANNQTTVTALRDGFWQSSLRLPVSDYPECRKTPDKSIRRSLRPSPAA